MSSMSPDPFDPLASAETERTSDPYDAGTAFETMRLPTDGSPGNGSAGNSSGSDPSSGSTSDTAKQEAAHVKDAAAHAGAQVVGTAKEEAGQVASDVKDQARMLTEQTRDQLCEQAIGQRDRAVDGLRSLSTELSQMSGAGEQSGLGTQLARQGADMTHQAADWLSDRDPGQILDELRGLARRRPGSFLLGAAVAGVLAGRLTRGVSSAKSSDSETSTAATGAGMPGSGPSRLGVDTTQTVPSEPYGAETLPVGSEGTGVRL